MSKDPALYRKRTTWSSPLCGACKHKISRHDAYCLYARCLCGLSMDECKDPLVVEREKARLQREVTSHRRYIRQQREKRKNALVR